MISPLYISALAASVKTAVVSTYRYVRIYITSNNGDSYTSIQEIEIASSYGGADITTTSMTTNQSDYYGSNLFSKAFDNSMEYTLACYVSATSINPPHWGYIDLGTAMTIKELRMWPQNYSGGPARAPKDFKIQGSNDLSTWVDLSNQTNITGWAMGSSKTFQF